MPDKYFFYYYQGVGGKIYYGKRDGNIDVPSPNTVEVVLITKHEFETMKLDELKTKYPYKGLSDLT